MTIGEKIRKRRLDAGLSQTELGSRVGLSCAMICRIELGEISPRFETLEKIARALKVAMPRLVA